MDDRLPTVRGRELSEGLRAAMRGAGYGVRELARRLDWPHPRVSHLLSGKRGGSELDVVTVLATRNVNRAERERLTKLCRELGTQGWLQQYGSRLPAQLKTYVDHENKATGIRNFQLALLPGMLQTESYARAVISRNANIPTDEVEGLVHARLTRQDILNNSRRPGFSYYLHESVLRLPIGGSAVMSDQLHYLRRLSVRPGLDLRAIPFAAGAHAALAGSFTLMEFDDFDPVIYLESEASAVFLEQQEQIVAYQRNLKSLAQIALDREESKELIAPLASASRSGRHGGRAVTALIRAAAWRSRRLRWMCTCATRRTAPPAHWPSARPPGRRSSRRSRPASRCGPMLIFPQGHPSGVQRPQGGPEGT